MRIGKVFGNVTLSRVHASVTGTQWKLVVPMDLDDLQHLDNEPAAEELVVYDPLSAAIGEWIAFSEGAEAAMPFYPEVKPVDAYGAAIIDELTIEVNTP
jgi:ethanolamine utilization protein EutN